LGIREFVALGKLHTRKEPTPSLAGGFFYYREIVQAVNEY
jgi:hypothetical protein